MFEYIIYLINIIRNYFTTVKYNLPFDINEIENDIEFNVFKHNDKEVNKVIFALNNLPENVHVVLFKNDNTICNKFYYITIKIKNKEIDELFHNIDTINDSFENNNIRYILIRINIIDNTNNIMNHVNSIIIDKSDKYILFFEPKVTFIYDIEKFTKIVDDIFINIVDIQSYKKLYPETIGYNSFNKLQNYDAFCQTYILFTYIMVTLNETVKPENFSLMFNATITSKNLGYLLFHINKLLKNNNLDICDQAPIWSFPTNKTKNMLNLLHLFFNKSESLTNKIIDEEINKLSIIEDEEEDIIIIDTIDL